MQGPECVKNKLDHSEKASRTATVACVPRQRKQRDVSRRRCGEGDASSAREIYINQFVPWQASVRVGGRDSVGCKGADEVESAWIM